MKCWQWSIPLFASFRADEDRVYLTGLSFGGAGNVALGDDRPESLGRDRANLWARRSQSGRSNRER